MNEKANKTINKFWEAYAKDITNTGELTQVDLEHFREIWVKNVLEGNNHITQDDYHRSNTTLLQLKRLQASSSIIHLHSHGATLATWTGANQLNIPIHSIDSSPRPLNIIRPSSVNVHLDNIVHYQLDKSITHEDFVDSVVGSTAVVLHSEGLDSKTLERDYTGLAKSFLTDQIIFALLEAPESLDRLTEISKHSETVLNYLCSLKTDLAGLRQFLAKYNQVENVEYCNPQEADNWDLKLQIEKRIDILKHYEDVTPSQRSSQTREFTWFSFNKASYDNYGSQEFQNRDNELYIPRRVKEAIQKL